MGFSTMDSGTFCTTVVCTQLIAFHFYVCFMQQPNFFGIGVLLPVKPCCCSYQLNDFVYLKYHQPHVTQIH